MTDVPLLHLQANFAESATKENLCKLLWMLLSTSPVMLRDTSCTLAICGLAD